MFQEDRPTLFRRLSRGLAIAGYLNVEVPKVRQRRVDLLIALADGALLHVEFQSAHDQHIGYRMMEYWALIKRRHGRPLRQVVVFVGQGARVPDRVEEDGQIFRYEVLDLRDIPAEDLIETGNPGDLALAVLANGGNARLREIVQRAAAMKGVQRKRLLAKILILSGLRGAAQKVELEMKHMGVIIDVTKNPVLMRMYREAQQIAQQEAEQKVRAEAEAAGRAKGMAEGRAEGRAEGMAEGESEILRKQLTAKFGSLPRWAAGRVSKATPTQIERWARKILVADTLEGVLGPRHRNGS